MVFFCVLFWHSRKCAAKLGTAFLLLSSGGVGNSIFSLKPFTMSNLCYCSHKRVSIMPDAQWIIIFFFIPKMVDFICAWVIFHSNDRFKKATAASPASTFAFVDGMEKAKASQTDLACGNGIASVILKWVVLVFLRPLKSANVYRNVSIVTRRSFDTEWWKMSYSILGKTTIFWKSEAEQQKFNENLVISKV